MKSRSNFVMSYVPNSTFVLAFAYLFFFSGSCSSFGYFSSDDETPIRSKYVEPKKIDIPGQIVNRVRYVVGTESITDLDIQQMKDKLRKSGRAKGGNLKKKAINELIERAIVAMEAEKQTIIISDLRIENEIKGRMQRMGVSNEDQFQKTTVRETGMPYEIWLEEMRYDLIKQQLVRIVLSVPAATDQEIESFYRKNNQKVGVEIRFREMIFIPGAGGKTESQISSLANDAYAQVRSNPANFASVARSNPDNVASTKAYGGLHNYVELSGIAESNRILAGVLFNTGVGQVSRVFRDSFGRYMIIKLEGKRPVPISKVRDLIRQRLYFEKQLTVFDDWIKKQKELVAIVVIK